MKAAFKRLIPQRVINLFYHYPVAVLANLIYGFPSRRLKVIGVTGTDGKTTTVNMIYKVLKDAGKRVSMISSINAVIGDKSYDTGFHVTSPSSLMVQDLARLASKAGSKYLVLEVTSHALDQYRFWGIRFDVGVITNITHEHLDYHRTFENYVNTKATLIRDNQWSILNYDDPSFNKLSKLAKGEVISFGSSPKADLNPKGFPLKLKIKGEYNVMNALAAAGVGLVLNVEKESIKKSLESFKGLVGRMDKIKNSKGINVVVDFAHTPNALEQALKSLRKETKRELIAVFGAAGARDKDKRPMMGEIAARLADKIVLTDEDPRYEDRMKIISEIASGVERVDSFSKKDLIKEPDRLKAIRKAIRLAHRGDTVGIFGKGHERSMNYRGKEKPWSDIEAAQKVLG